MTEVSPFALPHLGEIFDVLRRGRHFHHLGFRLVVHQRDFFYFRGKDSLSPQASRMAVFVFILIESLADQGEPVVDTLMTRTFTIADLPHLKGARYRAYLQEAGPSDEDELRGIVSNSSGSTSSSATPRTASPFGPRPIGICKP
jgi:hypothetical protein